jgi:aryl-alcohol dehydrogenase-like predicted oxidoreductase
MVISGTSSISHLDENAAAGDVTLDPAAWPFWMPG